jgi:hypothetical protein
MRMSSMTNDLALARDSVIDGKILDMQIRSASKTVLFPTPFTPTIKLNPG